MDPDGFALLALPTMFDVSGAGFAWAEVELAGLDDPESTARRIAESARFEATTRRGGVCAYTGSMGAR